MTFFMAVQAAPLFRVTHGRSLGCYVVCAAFKKVRR